MYEFLGGNRHVAILAMGCAASVRAQTASLSGESSSQGTAAKFPAARSEARD